MIILYVLLGVILTILLFLCCPVYVSFYFKETLSIKIKFLFFKFTLFPKKVKEKSKNNQTVSVEDTLGPQDSKRKNALLSLLQERGLLGFLTLLKTIVKILSGSTRKLYEKIQIKEFKLYIVVVGDDAADTAIKYGQAQAVVSVAANALLRGIEPRACLVQITPGFNQKNSSVDFYAHVCFFSISVLKIIIGILFDFVRKTYLKIKPNRKGVANE